LSNKSKGTESLEKEALLITSSEKYLFCLYISQNLTTWKVQS